MTGDIGYYIVLGIMKHYAILTEKLVVIRTNPEKYYLIYSKSILYGNYDGYVAIFKGNGNSMFYWELRALMSNGNTGKLDDYKYDDERLEVYKYYDDGDILFELTDQEVEDHILLASV